jgi:hypothetical protein
MIDLVIKDLFAEFIGCFENAKLIVCTNIKVQNELLRIFARIS